ncbi:hypothetical protein NP233_g13084 [Leucocoprinus birnbaumii]|uniref:Inosine/uridine-preferring nucleoside hydrolase domain-containing protein n=1 Tax=Leucocoprinus birnbaumii TaxID=56174 RepID=A0AAD5VFP6_9AGAR|nr:hypothetical protein NP233_g13084 [Leucocoprinus birnbaumii]
MKNVWLDVDPGHDDALAIMLAVHCPDINLIGVSTTHGNAPSSHTALNAARCLYAFGAPTHIKVYPGAMNPLIQPAKHDPEIHGEDGLGGVEGLPRASEPAVSDRFVRVYDGQDDDEEGEIVRGLEGMAKEIKKVWRAGKGDKVTIVSSGPMTNIALFVSVYSDLIEKGAIEEFVFMGGGVGMGNRSAVAEYNILTDPHATQIVLNTPVKTTMIPINVTHTAIATYEIQHRLLTGLRPSTQPTPHILIPGSPYPPLPIAKTPLRHTLSTVINYFASSYKSVFGFHSGPPLHDALTIAYLQNPGLFKGTRYRVDVELNSGHCMGETVVDVWNYRNCSEESWGREGKNCFVVQELDVLRFFDLFLGHPPTLEDFGFYIVEPGQEHMLLGLYTSLLRLGEVKPLSLHRWRLEGTLVENIKREYERLPGGNHGGYYHWFLQNQHVLSEQRSEDRDKRNREQLDASVLRTWTFIGKPSSASIEEVRQWVRVLPHHHRQCFSLYHFLLSGHIPVPQDDLWVNFGFCACPLFHAEAELGRAYSQLIQSCNFDDFCTAYTSSSLFSLFQAHQIEMSPLSVATAGYDDPSIIDVLSGSPYRNKSVWNLKQYIAGKAIHGPDDMSVRPIPQVRTDYGFDKCSTEEEHKLLFDLYTKYFKQTRHTPLELHNACIQGRLFEFFVGMGFTLKPKKMAKRLLRNPYPLRVEGPSSGVAGMTVVDGVEAILML